MSLVSDKTDGKAVARVKEEQKNQDQAPYIFCALSVYGFYRTGANCWLSGSWLAGAVREEGIKPKAVSRSKITART